ncbi:hypothetical protein [Dietzia maris]|uniref:hypothetical protein n=1 Tax=Dietzia maris TaxID=37915 RepID=UPI0037C805E5
MTEPKTLSTREVAEKVGTDPKTLRAFLRATSQGVGSGKRYALPAKDVAKVKKEFVAWEAERQAAREAAKATDDQGPCDNCGAKTDLYHDEASGSSLCEDCVPAE